MRSHSKQQGGGKNKDETQSWSLPQTCRPQGSQVLWNGSIWYHPLKYGQGNGPRDILPASKQDISLPLLNHGLAPCVP